VAPWHKLIQPAAFSNIRFTEESTVLDETLVKGQPRNAPVKKSKKD
jgi:hypothetical protein